MHDIVFELPFFGGIDESTRDEYLEPGAAFRVIENVRQERRGGFSKRPGYEPLGRTRLDGSTRSTGRRLLMNGKQLCTIDDAELDAYSAAAEQFIVRGLVPEADYSFIEAPSFANESLVSDVAYVDGYLVVAYTVVTGGLGTDRYASVVVLDADSYAVVLGPQALDSASSIDSIGLATYGEVCVLLVDESDASEVRAHYLDVSNLGAGWQSIGVVATDYAASLAVAKLPTRTDRVAFAYSVDGTNAVTVKTLNASGVLETVSIFATGTVGLHSVDLSEHGSTLWVCWAESTTCKVIGLNPRTSTARRTLRPAP